MVLDNSDKHNHLLLNQNGKNYCLQVFDDIAKLNNFEGISKGIIIFFIGNVNRAINLNFDAGTEVYGSCGATLNGQFMIIGGLNEKRQVRNNQIII